MTLPGTPVDIKLRCPTCGWDFMHGLRALDHVETDNTKEERAVTCCSKCLTCIEFDLDGGSVTVVTDERLRQMPREGRVMVLKLRFLAWLAQQAEMQGRPLQ